MKRVFYLIRNLRKDLSGLFISALLIIALIDFWLSNIPELFSGGFKLGQIIYKICLSYISAFIFYFLVVHIKQQKDKQNLNTYISKKVNMIIGSASNLARELAKSSNIKLAEKFPSKNEMNIICTNINPNGKAPLILGNLGNYANWIQYFDFCRNNTQDTIAKIIKKISFLDSDLVRILAEIEDNTFFRQVELCRNTSMSNVNITFLENCLSKYFDLITELENYSKKKLIEK